MYHVFKRNYPQPDIDICEEWGCDEFKTLKQANKFIEEIEEGFRDIGWAGHPNYYARFYVEKV